MGFSYTAKLFGGTGAGLPAGLVYNDTTNTFDVTDGRVQAANLKAIGLDTPGGITVVPTLTQVATITTVQGADLADGDWFAVPYGAGTVPIEFDAAPGDGTTGGRIPLVFDGSEDGNEIRDAIITLLNTAAPTYLTASIGGAGVVSIALDTPGATGDPLTENVTNAEFLVTGFADPPAATTYTYVLVARLPDGTTTEAGVESTTGQGPLTLSAANYNALSWDYVPGSSGFDVYRKVGGATQGKIASNITALSLNDTGLAAVAGDPPTHDRTGSVVASSMELSGLSEYADNAAALAAGLVAGDVYRTGAGALMIVYGGA